MYSIKSDSLLRAGVFVFAAFLGSTVWALEKSEVRGFIEHGDAHGAERAFGQLQDQVLAGAAKRREQTLAYAVFEGTDPAIDGFLTTWLREFPASTHAHLARSMADYESAFRIRGTRLAKVTYFEALTEFSRLRARAHDHALRAYEIDPHLSEAGAHLLMVSFTTLSSRDYFTLFQTIFADHPYHQHLFAAANKTNPNWRGTWDQAEWLCENFAHKVKDMEGYTAEVCKVDLAFGHNHRDPRGMPDPEIFETSNSPALEPYRSRYVFAVGPDHNQAQERALDAARNGDIDNLDLAREFDRYFPGQGSMFDIIYERKWEEAKREIAHDPYNSRYIKVLRMEAGPSGLLPNRPSHEESIALLKRALLAHPYDGFLWSELGDLVARSLDPDNPEEADPFYINGMVYSNFHPSTVGAYRFHRKALYLHVNPGPLAVIRSRGDRQKPTGTVLGNMPPDALICPLIRITRFEDALCEETGDPDQCHSGQKNEMILRNAESKAGVQGICHSELRGTFEDLVYTPFPDALSDQPVSQ